MIILGLDTSTRAGSVAIFDTEGQAPCEITTSGSAKHSENLVPDIDKLLSRCGLALDEIDLIAVAIGPGSFTGLRVGLSTAKGFSYSLNKPLVAVDSLMARAFSAGKTGETAVCLDAMRGEVFGGVFSFYKDKNPNEIVASSIFSAEKFAEICKSRGISSIYTDSVGDDVQEIMENCDIDIISFDYNSLNICKLGYITYKNNGSDDINTLSPRYLRDFLPGVPR
ncbi:MAG TPA: tRNA (adenosine(37)-N6)-threonylcarbamoyltransferase complex dimerization subunit type 1 TsaB [candidate division Zixibacteria bacterium]|nr:tRNA (adenosine(37)-N6)-threonylcarbamoyltransferase complex dimerization subunit type 1 TsaB [candidate division Zixibacteria bacterium]